MVGICPVHIYKKGVLKLLLSSLSSNEIPYGGWIYNRDSTSIKELLQRTKLYFNESLTYWSTIQTNRDGYEIPGANKSLRFNTVIFPLTNSIDHIFNITFKQKQRNKIRRAQKLGITVEEISHKNIDLFINLSNELKEKSGMRVGLPEFYRKVMEAYTEEKRVVCLAARNNDQYISSMILVANKNYTIAWVAGRKAEVPNNLYQNELLIWESIVWAKNFGSKNFDLCGLDEFKLPQLARIKLSFSKEIIPFYCIIKKSFFFRVINKLQNVFIT